MTPTVLRLSYIGVLNFLCLNTVEWADMLIDGKISSVLGPTFTKGHRCGDRSVTRVKNADVLHLQYFNFSYLSCMLSGENVLKYFSIQD